MPQVSRSARACSQDAVGPPALGFGARMIDVLDRKDDIPMAKKKMIAA